MLAFGQQPTSGQRLVTHWRLPARRLRLSTSTAPQLYSSGFFELGRAAGRHALSSPSPSPALCQQLCRLSWAPATQQHHQHQPLLLVPPDRLLEGRPRFAGMKFSRSKCSPRTGKCSHTLGSLQPNCTLQPALHRSPIGALCLQVQWKSACFACKWHHRRIHQS